MLYCLGYDSVEEIKARGPGHYQNEVRETEGSWKDGYTVSRVNPTLHGVSMSPCKLRRVLVR